jgi:hypothetical protein
VVHAAAGDRSVVPNDLFSRRDSLQTGQTPGKLVTPKPIQRPQPVPAALNDAGILEHREVMRDEGRRQIQGGANGAAGQLTAGGEQFNYTVSIDVRQRRECAYDFLGWGGIHRCFHMLSGTVLQ